MDTRNLAQRKEFENIKMQQQRDQNKPLARPRFALQMNSLDKSQLPENLPVGSTAVALTDWRIVMLRADMVAIENRIEANAELILADTIDQLGRNLLVAKEKGELRGKSSINASIVMGNTITTANAGDTRAMLLFREKDKTEFSCLRLSYDHVKNNDNMEEDQRIRHDKHRALMASPETYRSGVFNLSRMLGCTLPGVTYQPGITSLQLPDNIDEAYLINTTKGLTSVMQEKHIADFVNEGLTAMPYTSQIIADILTKAVKARGNQETMILVTALPSKKCILSFVAEGIEEEGVASDNIQMFAHDYCKENFMKIFMDVLNQYQPKAEETAVTEKEEVGNQPSPVVLSNNPFTLHPLPREQSPSVTDNRNRRPVKLPGGSGGSCLIS